MVYFLSEMSQLLLHEINLCIYISRPKRFVYKTSFSAVQQVILRASAVITYMPRCNTKMLSNNWQGLFEMTSTASQSNEHDCGRILIEEKEF